MWERSIDSLPLVRAQRDREKHWCERNISWLPSICPLTGDRTCSLFGYGTMLQLTEPHWPGWPWGSWENILEEKVIISGRYKIEIWEEGQMTAMVQGITMSGAQAKQKRRSLMMRWSRSWLSLSIFSFLIPHLTHHVYDSGPSWKADELYG